MPDPPEHLAHLEDRDGLLVVGAIPSAQALQAVKRSVFTMAQAVQVADAVQAALEDRAWLDPDRPDATVLYLRDPERPDLLVPVPLLQLNFHAPVPAPDRFILELDGGKRPCPSNRWEPDILPMGPDMRPGSVRFAEGAAYLEFVFDQRGVYKECSRAGGDTPTSMYFGDCRPCTVDPLTLPPQTPPIGLLCREDLDPAGHEPAALARMVTELCPHERVAARVRLPMPVPDGPRAVLGRGLAAIRRALEAGSIPDEARWVVCDGFVGEAMASGTSLQEAFAAWTEEVERVRPGLPAHARPTPREEPDPPTPEDGSESVHPSAPTRLDERRAARGEPTVVRDDEGEVVGWRSGSITLTSPPREPGVPWPLPAPRNVPGVAVPLSPLPARIPRPFADAGFRVWVRVIGELGHSGLLLLREDGEGEFTTVGEGVLELVDPSILDAELDAADEAWAEHIGPMADPGFSPAWQHTSYSVWDGGRRLRIPAKATGWTTRPEAPSPWLAPAGDQAWRVTRCRRTK